MQHPPPLRVGGASRVLGEGRAAGGGGKSRHWCFPDCVYSVSLLLVAVFVLLSSTTTLRTPDLLPALRLHSVGLLTPYLTMASSVVFSLGPLCRRTTQHLPTASRSMSL